MSGTLASTISENKFSIKLADLQVIIRSLNQQSFNKYSTSLDTKTPAIAKWAAHPQVQSIVGGKYLVKINNPDTRLSLDSS